MIERVIEEQAGRDAVKAERVRSLVKAAIGDNLGSIKPGSTEAARLKGVLIEQGLACGLVLCHCFTKGNDIIERLC